MKLYIKEFEDTATASSEHEDYYYSMLSAYQWSKEEGFPMVTFGDIYPAVSDVKRIARGCREYGIKEFAVLHCDVHFIETLARLQELGITPARTENFEFKSRPAYLEGDQKYTQPVLIMRVN